VNSDASLFFSAPDSDLAVRHGGVDPPDHFGSDVRRTEAHGSGLAARNLRRSKSGRGHSNCKSPLDGGTGAHRNSRADAASA
jgi:hypothetical protein